MDITPTPTAIPAYMVDLVRIGAQGEMQMYLTVILMGVIVGCCIAVILSIHFSR